MVPFKPNQEIADLRRLVDGLEDRAAPQYVVNVNTRKLHRMRPDLVRSVDPLGWVTTCNIRFGESLRTYARVAELPEVGDRSRCFKCFGYTAGCAPLSAADGPAPSGTRTLSSP